MRFRFFRFGRRKNILGPRRQRPTVSAWTKWETIAEILLAGGTFILAMGTMYLASITKEHTAETSKIVDQIEKARKQEIIPRVVVDSVKYGSDSSGDMDGYLYVFIQNIGEGNARDLSIALARCDTHIYVGPCIVEDPIPGKAFSPDLLSHLYKKESRKISIDILNLYPEKPDWNLYEKFWQKQRYTVFLWYTDAEGDIHQTSREVSYAPQIEDISYMATEIEDTSKGLRHQNGETKNIFKRIGSSDSLFIKSSIENENQ